MRQYSSLVAPTTTRRDGLTAKIPNDDDEEEANQAGMASAFRELEALDSLDDDDKSVPKKGGSSVKGIDDLEDVKQLKNMKATPEAEVKLYKDMMNESEKEDVELYVDIMTDMGGTTPKPKKKQTLKIQDEQVELLDSLERSPEDLNVFMNQALQEALKEAKSKTPEELASIDPLDDEDMMDEIRNVFDRANDELLASLEDIRKEQVRFYITVCVTIECAEFIS
jgi:Ulp1 family protease